ncbi:hypothetical protein NCH95_004456, partial [Salmonella enterica]|nr:hypothetical protein [Salmonella enterica]
ALALLDENLQLQRDKDSLEAAAIAMRDDMREAREKLESAENNLIDSECHVAELEESLRDKQALLEAAEKAAIAVCNRSNHWKERAETAEERIAELEARTTGSETSFTFDAFEASGFAKGGWSVQEYVEIERYQAAVTGNSPVATDGLCPCCGRKPLKHIKCSVPGCGRKHVAHGLCQRHYDMKRREDPEQVEKFREANRRFTAKKRAQKTSAPQQEVKNG